MKTTISLTFVLIILLFINCKKGNKPTESQKYNKTPEQINDGFETAHLSTVSIDENLIVSMLNEISDGTYQNIHSILIIKDNKLVFEEYFDGEKFALGQYTGEFGFSRDDKHNLCSASKSFVSALIGIAIDKGFIVDKQEKVFSYFPEYADLLITNPEKESLTLKHLLMMSSGLEWDDEITSYNNPQNDMFQLFNSNDPIRYILAKDLVYTPGSAFEYKNCNTNILGEIIKKATGKRIDDFADEYLFSELGIEQYEWQMIKDNVVFVSGELKLRPRDMAKFGYLHLNKGEWHGKYILSEDWINESTAERFTLPVNWWEDGYAYQWWLKAFSVGGRDIKSYFAQGWGGQLIFIFQELDMVVVFTGGNYFEQIPNEQMLSDFILPAVLKE